MNKLKHYCDGHAVCYCDELPDYDKVMALLAMAHENFDGVAAAYREARAERDSNEGEVKRLGLVIDDYVALTRLLDEHPEDWGNQQWCECKLCLSYLDPPVMF